jgi:hypothetical protein
VKEERGAAAATRAAAAAVGDAGDRDAPLAFGATCCAAGTGLHRASGRLHAQLVRGPAPVRRARRAPASARAAPGEPVDPRAPVAEPGLALSALFGSS